MGFGRDLSSAFKMTESHLRTHPRALQQSRSCIHPLQELQELQELQALSHSPPQNKVHSSSRVLWPLDRAGQNKFARQPRE